MAIDKKSGAAAKKGGKRGNKKVYVLIPSVTTSAPVVPS